MTLLCASQQVELVAKEKTVLRGGKRIGLLRCVGGHSETVSVGNLQQQPHRSTTSAVVSFGFLHPKRLAEQLESVFAFGLRRSCDNQLRKQSPFLPRPCCLLRGREKSQQVMPIGDVPVTRRQCPTLAGGTKGRVVGVNRADDVVVLPTSEDLQSTAWSKRTGVTDRQDKIEKRNELVIAEATTRPFIRSWELRRRAYATTGWQGSIGSHVEAICGHVCFAK